MEAGNGMRALIGVSVDPMAAVRIYRVVADPEMAGSTDRWLIGGTFEADQPREVTEALIDKMLEEGYLVQDEDQMLAPAGYEDA